MKLKRFIAAMAALCVLAAPAAFAATAPGGQAAPATGTTSTATTPTASAAAARERSRHRAYRRHLHLTHLLVHMTGRHVGPAHFRRARSASLTWLQRHNQRLRREIRHIWHQERRMNRRYRAALRLVPYGTLHAIATCESHNNPRAIGGGGAYRGLFQMTFQIWGAVGGHGDPAAAAVKEQYLRAAMVYHRYGSGQWPVCGR